MKVHVIISQAGNNETVSLQILVLVSICWMFYSLQSTFIYITACNPFKVMTLLSLEESNKAPRWTDDS